MALHRVGQIANAFGGGGAEAVGAVIHQAGEDGPDDDSHTQAVLHWSMERKDRFRRTPNGDAQKNLMKDLASVTIAEA